MYVRNPNMVKKTLKSHPHARLCAAFVDFRCCLLVNSADCEAELSTPAKLLTNAARGPAATPSAVVRFVQHSLLCPTSRQEVFAG